MKKFAYRRLHRIFGHSEFLHIVETIQEMPLLGEK